MAQFQWDIVGGTGSSGTSMAGAVKSGGSAIGTSGVRVTIDTANAGNKLGVLDALDVIRNSIAQDTWPPT